MRTVAEVGAKLVELCRQDRNLEAIETLYRSDAVSVEAMGTEAMPAVHSGADAIRGKNEWWVANNEVHSSAVHGPFPNGDRFAVIFELDFTPKAGPRTGQRTRLEEVGLYTVENGEIVREEFFYDLG